MSLSPMEEEGGNKVRHRRKEEEELIGSFCCVTSSSPEEAAFFLESHRWRLDAAIHSFFDDHPPQPPGDADDPDEDEDEDYVPSPEGPTRGRGEESPPSPVRREKKRKRRRGREGSGGGGRRVRNLADLNREISGSDEEDVGEEEEEEEKEEGGEEYYTGGEKSEMLVREPAKGKNNADKIFEQAQKMGALKELVENACPSSSRTFTGRGRLLSDESVPAASQPQHPENITRNITFWTNGFSVDDGPLRRFNDPANASFLESIRKSVCPKELEPSDRRATVHVNLIRKEEKYPEPVRHRGPFKGKGQTLGGGTTDDLKFKPPASTGTASKSTSSPIGLSVDDTLPSTSLQLRLADGTRMVARFNTHHTVGDIHAFINASRTGATRNYLLQTVGFPPQQLTDVSQTIEHANLANSVIIQRLK